MLIAHLSGSSDGHGVAVHPAALAGHQEGDVDAFLDVAARLGDDLAHLAGHGLRQPLLVVGHELREAVEDLAALRGGRPLPHRAGRPGGADGHRDVGLGPLLEAADDVTAVGGVAALEGLAARRVAPLAGDEVMEGRDVVRRRAGAGRALSAVMRHVPGQTRSNAAATEPPPPRHSVARP